MPGASAEVPIVETTVETFETATGTMLEEVDAYLSLPDGTRPLLRGLARHPVSGDLFAIGTVDLSQAGPTQVFRVDLATRKVEVVGEVPPSTGGAFLEGLAIDSAGVGFSVRQTTFLGSGNGRIAFFPLSAPSQGGDIDAGFVVQGLAFHPGEGKIFAFGNGQTGLVVATFGPGAAGPRRLSGPVPLVAASQNAPLLTQVTHATHAGGNRFLLNTGGRFFAEVTVSSSGGGTITDRTAPELQQFNIAAGAGLVLKSVCGDGRQENGETCESGDLTRCDGCAFCRAEEGPRCGDGIANLLCGEECDDGLTENGDGCSAMCLLEPIVDIPANFDRAGSLMATLAAQATTVAPPAGVALCLPPDPVAAVAQQARVAAKRLNAGQRQTGIAALGRLLELIATQTNAHGGLLDLAGQAMVAALLTPEQEATPLEPRRARAPSRGTTFQSATTDLLAQIGASSLPASERQSLSDRVRRAMDADPATQRRELGGAARRLSELAADPSVPLPPDQAVNLILGTISALTAFDPAPAVVTLRNGILAGDFEAAAQSHMQIVRSELIATLRAAVTPQTANTVAATLTTDLILQGTDLPSIEFREARSEGSVLTYAPDCDGEWRLLSF